MSSFQEQKYRGNFLGILTELALEPSPSFYIKCLDIWMSSCIGGIVEKIFWPLVWHPRGTKYEPVL